MKSNFSCLPLALRRLLIFLAILNVQITKVSGANIFDGTGFNSQYDIQPCTEENKGDCNCGTGTIKTYVFWPGDYIRCIHTFVPDSAENLPVLVSFSAYGQGELRPFAANVKAAEYYGYALIGLGSTGPFDGAGGFGLEFPSNGVVNYDNPLPCTANDSRDYGYVEGTLDLIASSSELDETKVFMEGFSQNSMYAAYASVCFADRVAGLWQGGSGLAKTFHTPITPGKQAQCSLSDFLEYGNNCCEEHFCNDCTVWPLFPKTCENKLIDCIATYTNDNIACGSDFYAYEAMVEEGNDARMLSFAHTDTLGGHRNPANQHSWIAGCLGIVDSCSDACESSFLTCMGGVTGVDEFEACETQLKNGNLSNCEVGCAPTLEMLKTSQTPSVINLSEGKFGTQTGLPVPDVPEEPNCLKAFGRFDDEGVNVGARCKAPPGSGPATGELEECADSSCEDSPFPFKRGKNREKDCDWVALNTDQRCEKYGTHCPNTCSQCSVCEDSSRRFKMKESATWFARCKWVANKAAKRCQRQGVAETCRKTCELCA